MYLCFPLLAEWTDIVIVGRVYLPALLYLKNAGYGVGSFGSTAAAAAPPCTFPLPLPAPSGIIKLGALALGVRKCGVWIVEVVAAERELSLLRERFEEAGDAGTERLDGVADMSSVSVLRPPLRRALRRSARSLCSLKTLNLCVAG